MFLQKSSGKLSMRLILTLKWIDWFNKSLGFSGNKSSSKSSFPSSSQGTKLMKIFPTISLFSATIGIYLGLSIK